MNISSFLRAQHLTMYIVHKHFPDSRSEPMEKFPLGDKLYETGIHFHGRIKIEAADLYKTIEERIRKSGNVTVYYNALLKHVLEELNIERIGFTFGLLLICCEHCKENRMDDEVEKLVGMTANALWKYQAWIEEHVLKKVFKKI